MLYIDRVLFSEDRKFTEPELLTYSSVIVILAEPGAGKTELLRSLAKRLGTNMKSANVFRNMGVDRIEVPLVIDAFDELAKIDERGIHQLFANIAKSKPTHVIISSRSSEWNNSATSNMAEYIGQEPLVVRLCEFDKSEQQQIYSHYTQQDNFHDFQEEVTRFDLGLILSNPQFLKMFADAFIESNGKFTNKNTIFSQAVARLAREANENVKPTPSLSHSEKVELSSEIFAKILLAGAEGVGISEASENRMYPALQGLINNSTAASPLLSTRLFKPSENPDHHQPVHKIISEYCAATYFIKRINVPSDPLGLEQLLSIIAPNSMVRNELRGLIGWMASLGSKSVQERLIQLDPYAVLANGDPSQLVHSSKVSLLTRLKEVEAEDPYFRRGDFWRKFNVSGFFTKDVALEIKSLLLTNKDGHLRDLLLELLINSQVSSWLSPELRQITLDSEQDKHTRILAHRCLLNSDCYDPKSCIEELVQEASAVSLRMVTEAMDQIGITCISTTTLEVFFRQCINLYETRSEKIIGETYFIKGLIRKLPLGMIEYLLDSLSDGLSCTCGKKAFECNCRLGVSKIIGSLLDRYFELTKSPLAPLKVWGWIKELNFELHGVSKDIVSVRALQENTPLRQGIIQHVFSSLTDQEQIFQLRVNKFEGYHSHAGLCLRTEDYIFIADLAFSINNVNLWASFLPPHYFHRPKEQRGPDQLRRYMRLQANEKADFMAMWASRNKRVRRTFPDSNRRYRRLVKRQERRQMSIHSKNIDYVNEHRDLIISGRHWGYLQRFAELVLNRPDDIVREFGDEHLVRTALRNCLDFIEPNIPDLQQLAELQCQSKSRSSELILFAACIEIMRFNSSLESVPYQALMALRTNFNMGWNAIEEDERASLKSEVDRLVFTDVNSIETFLRRYVEPQLKNQDCKHPDVSLLKYDETFFPLRGSLSVEWLNTYENLGAYALEILFELAVNYGDREELNKVVIERCSSLLLRAGQLPENKGLDEAQKFWFVRAFYFLDINVATPYFKQLALDKHSLLLFEALSGRMNRGENSCWPELCAQKVEVILDKFISEWPEVHLPNHWGTGSPVGETAYRFIKDIIWFISRDIPDKAIPVIKRLLADSRFENCHQELKSIQAEQNRAKALQHFEPPIPQKVVDFLDKGEVVTVEAMRQQLLQELINYQRQILGGEFNTVNRFYTKDKAGSFTRLGEVDSVNIVAEYLSSSLRSKDISIVKEHETKNHNRIDITATKMLNGSRSLLVVEAKGQWHNELYSAASTQLHERYSIHPDAEQQGIYLVFWFGSGESVANNKKHNIANAQELKQSIELVMPPELTGVIDVFVLDVSRS
ncbi:ATP-binding protein [Vibrio alginolyticus]|uniref:NACHT domain-containing protein n=1 Tax=Vibrio alginolyticus TaxID=663 RepID=UPI00375514CD